MATRTKTPPKKPAAAATPESQATTDVYKLQIYGMDGDDFVARQDTRVGESTAFWNEKKFNLKKATEENESLYLGRQVSDNDDGSDNNLSLDNRIFSSVRTIVPYVMTRITEPEVYPSSNQTSAKRFAEDMEKALYIKAEKEGVKRLMKYALEDAMIRRRGYLKPRYDAATKNFCKIEYIPAESIIIDHKVRSYEEPRYFRHELDKSAEDLIDMFPEMKPTILTALGIIDENDAVKMQASHTIHEDWVMVPGEGELDLVVCWHYKGKAFGAVQDPNWRYDKENFLDNHMMPLVFVNVLNDGRTYIDKTSFVEQSKYLQKTIDKRREQIGKAASLGSIGMPVVDSAALADDQADFLSYDEDTVLELDVSNAGKNSINDVFTTWKAQQLSGDVYTDKNDAVEGVQNAFGASSIFQGNQSDSKTLGQDELMRDQSMGRQQEIVDAIDVAMERLYQLMAQFLLVYGDEKELFRFVGESSQFDYIIMSSSDLDTNAEIRVKSGTSMPIDNPQRRATADKASQQGMIDPLTYWEIMDEPNAEKIARRIIDYKANPIAFLKDTDEELFNRDAFIDIEIIKQDGTPPFRDSLPKEYYDYLNQFVVAGNLENPKIPLATRQKLSQFIDQQLARAQKALGMASTQLPTPQDVVQHNAAVDAVNAAPQPPMPGQDDGSGGAPAGVTPQPDPAAAAAQAAAQQPQA